MFKAPVVPIVTRVWLEFFSSQRKNKMYKINFSSDRFGEQFKKNKGWNLSVRCCAKYRQLKVEYFYDHRFS